MFLTFSGFFSPKVFARLPWYYQLCGSQPIPNFRGKITSKSEKKPQTPNLTLKRTKEPQLRMQVSRQFFLSPMPCWSTWSLWGIRMPSHYRDFIQRHAAGSLCPLIQMDKTASFLEEGSSPFPFLSFPQANVEKNIASVGICA